MTNKNKIEEEAADWVSREDQDNWSSDDTRAKEAWLNQSLEHRVTYLQMKSTWQRADRLAILRGADPGRFSPLRPTARSLFAIAASLTLLMGAGVSVYYYSFSGKRYVTEIGAHEIVRLADGTQVELNTDTRVTAKVDGAQRTVTLKQGEAYFQVVHDARRPFVVLAGNTRITDVGTKFSVRVNGDDVKVIVTEGKVSIQKLGDEQSHDLMAARGTETIARSDAAPVIKTKTAEEIRDALGWRQGLLIFDQETLGDAAAEFNRYNSKKIVVTGEAAQRMHIGGSFEAGNIDVFGRILKQDFGLRVEDRDDEIIISQ